MRTVICTFLLYLSLEGAASAADPIRCLPPLNDLVKQRLALLDGRQRIERKKEAFVQETNGWLNKLLIDRLSGTYSFGKGLTVDSSVDGTASHTIVETSKSSSAWALTYTLPLSVFTDRHMTKEKTNAEINLVTAKQALERRDETMKINLLYGDLSEAKTKLLAFCIQRDDATCLPLVFLARKAAVSLLCLTGLKETGDRTEWDGLWTNYAADMKRELACANG